MFKKLDAFTNNLWKYVHNMYKYFDKDKIPHTSVTKYSGRANINGRNIYIPKGTAISWPVDREGNYSRD